MTNKGKKRIQMIFIFLAFLFLFLIIMAIAPNTSVPIETQSPSEAQASVTPEDSETDNVVSTIELPKAPSVFSAYYNGSKLDVDISYTKNTEAIITSDNSVRFTDIEIRGQLPLLGEVSVGNVYSTIPTKYDVDYDTDAIGNVVAEFMTSSVISLFENGKSTTDTFNNDDISEIILTRIKASYLPYEVMLTDGSMYGEVSMSLIGKVDYTYMPLFLDEPRYVTDCPILITYVYDDNSGTWVQTEYISPYVTSNMFPTDISANYLTTDLSK